MNPMRGMQLVILTVALSLCTFMQVLDYSIANVSIPYIAGGLAVSDNDGTWVITVFAVGNAIALPMTGWLARRFGSVRTIVLSTILFSILSWLCGAALSFNMLIISRFLQGVVAGPLIPLSQSLLMQNYPKEQRNLALTLWSIIVVVAPVAGPILGGWLTYDYSWPWIFYINVPIGFISAALIYKLLKPRETEKVKDPVDWLGLFLLAVGLASLQILLDQGEQYDWFRNNIIRALGAISFISLVYLVIWELGHKYPLIDLRLLKLPNFSLGTFMTAISYMVLFGAIVITPLWLQDFMNYTALWAGLAVAPMGIIPILALYPVSKLMGHVSLKPLIALCFITYAAALFYFTVFTTDVSFNEIAISRLFLGIGISFYLPPLMAITLAHVPAEKLSSATGIYHFFRIFAGGAGTSLFVTLWTRRTIFHHSNLAAFVNRFNSGTKRMMTDLENLGLSSKQALAAFNDIVDQQASMLATNDVFFLSGWVFIALLACIFFFKKRKAIPLNK